jgi:hypothetical protein
MGNANAADNSVEGALENGTAASSAGYAVEKALKNDTEMNDADNAVQEALENGAEDRAGAVSEESAEIVDAGSAQENGEESKQP